MLTKHKSNIYTPEKTFCLFNFVQESATIGIWEVDLETMKTTWSHVTKEIHEVDIDFEPTVESGILFYKEGYSRNTINTLFTKCIKEFENFDTELQIITAKGNEKWVRAIGVAQVENGKAIKVSGAFQDIDDKTKVLKKIALREEQFRKTFEFSRVGMVIVNLQGKWIKVNNAICEMLGYTSKELLSFSYSDITYFDDLDISNKAFNNLLGGKLDSFEIQKRYVHKNSSVVWTILSISLVKNDIGKPIHFVFQVNDITKIKEAEKNINSLLEVSKKQNKRLLNFAHIVSHNLRSHFSNLDMLTDIMQIDIPEATQNDIFPLLKEAISHLGESIDNLNQVAILKSNLSEKIESINLKNAFKKSTASVKGSIIKYNVIINTSIDKDITVSAIPAYLDSILFNLLTNSIKYRSFDRPLKVDVSAKKEGDYVIIKFKDNGLGIDLKLHGNKIFGMYKTFHDYKDSKGLGLFITKNHVESMGGDISLKSKVNVGTTFTILLRS